MKNTKIILFLFSIITSLTVKAVEINDKGYRLSGDAVIKDYTMMSMSPTPLQLSNYIVKKNYRVNRQEADEIAENIILASSCFNVDPWVLTALIQKESSFQKDAVSPTNAAGLTQFTSIGFQEVHDQLGYRGRAGATANATIYFTSKIRSCIDENWIDLWARVDVLDTDPEYYNLLKEEIKKDVPTAVLYGVILLKTYLSYVDSRSEVELPKSELYFQALQIYNGEPGEAKVNYAKNVFRNLQDVYPTRIKFEFPSIKISQHLTKLQ